MKLNVDAHYSSAIYQGLNFIQFKDGRDKVILTRHDQAGFRLDTTYTLIGNTSLFLLTFKK